MRYAVLMLTVLAAGCGESPRIEGGELAIGLREPVTNAALFMNAASATKDAFRSVKRPIAGETVTVSYTIPETNRLGDQTITPAFDLLFSTDDLNRAKFENLSNMQVLELATAGKLYVGAAPYVRSFCTDPAQQDLYRQTCSLLQS